ncbi:MAG: AraC family transcriptional regulator [Gammaproteobacteria bacterium]
MIQTPNYLLQTPFATYGPAGSLDVLSDVLRVVRLSDAVLFRGELSAPWALESLDSAQLAPVLLPDAKRLALFHLVAEGCCWIALPDRHQVQLASGDLVILPYGDEHTLGSDGAHDPVPVTRLAKHTNGNAAPSVVACGGGGEITRLICGFVHCDELLFSPLLKTLPPLMHVRTVSDSDQSLLATTARNLVRELHTADAGSACVLARLTELLFIEVLRRHMASLPPDTIGWLTTFNDPMVGRALQLLHADPAYAWTVDRLAHQVGTSRSLLAARFKRLVGQPPMQYLTCWRLQLAARLLRDGVRGMAAIAARVGYESEAAFNRAFKRYTGEPPGAWRAKVTNVSTEPGAPGLQDRGDARGQNERKGHGRNTCSQSQLSPPFDGCASNITL